MSKEPITTEDIRVSPRAPFGRGTLVGSMIKVRNEPFGSISFNDQLSIFKWNSVIDRQDYDTEAFSWFEIAEPDHATWKHPLSHYCRVQIGFQSDIERIYRLKIADQNAEYQERIQQPIDTAIEYSLYTGSGKSTLTISPLKDSPRDALGILVVLQKPKTFELPHIRWILDHHAMRFVRGASAEVFTPAFTE